MAVLLVFFLAACSGPSEDIPRAEVVEQPAPQADPTPAEEVTEPAPSSPESEPSIDSDSQMGEDNSVTVITDQSTVNFIGFGPGKHYVGTFEEWAAVVYVEDEQIIGVRGSMDATTLTTNGSGGLENHLRSADFFDVANHPIVLFEADIEDGIATGPLTLKGVTRQLRFPVEVTENSVKADFVISLQDFDISYPGVNDEAQLKFDMNI